MVNTFSVTSITFYQLFSYLTKKIPPKSYILVNPNRFYESIIWNELDTIMHSFPGSFAKSVKDLPEAQHFFKGKQFDIIDTVQVSKLQVSLDFNVFFLDLSKNYLNLLRQLNIILTDIDGS